MIAESLKKWISYVTRWINIKNYVGYGTGTSITGYTSSTNYYTCPKDGFIQLFCYYTNGNWVQVTVANSDGSNATMFQQTSTGVGHRIISIPVFKNQRVWVNQNGSNNAVTFNPYLTGTSDFPTPVIPAAMVDYVIESGNSGIWTYQKWNSGIAECWCTSTRTGTWTAWGSLYELVNSNGYQIDLPNNLFVSTPICVATVGSNETGGFFLETFQAGSTTKTPGYIPLRPTASGATTVNINIYAKGRWK